MARKRLTSLPDELWEKLADLEACVRQLDVVRGLGWTLALAAVFVGLGLIADITVDLPLAFRIALLVLAGVVSLGSVVWMIWRPWRRHHSVVDLAAVVERAHPELKESLVSCIELYDTTIPESERGSPLMRELAAKQTLRNVAPLDFRDSVSARPAHRMLVGGLVAWMLLLAPLAALANYRLLVARFFAPWENLDRVTSFWFDVEKGDRVVVRGSDVILTAHPKGDATDFPETALLSWVDEQGESDSRRIDYDATAKHYSTTLPHVMHGFRFHLSSAGNRSREYHIRVVEAPAITELKLDLQPPAYTGQPAKVLDGPVGEITVLERSRLRWKLTFNKPMQAAEWKWEPDTTISNKPVEAADPQDANAVAKTDDKSTEQKAKPDTNAIPLKLSADRLSASYEQVPEHGGAFRFVVRDEHGLTNESDPSRHLTVQADQPPTLQVSGGGDAQTAQATDVVPIEVTAGDDIGIGALELHYEVDAARQGIVKCNPQELGKIEVKHLFGLELAGLNLRDGEMLSYRVRAADERPVPGPNETWSDRRLIRIDSNAKPPGSDQLAADQGELEKSLEKLLAVVKTQRENTEKLESQAADAAKDPEAVSADTAAETQQQLEATSDEQEALQARIEQLAAAFQKHPLFENLTQQTQQLAQEEFAKAQEALNAAEHAKPEQREKDLQAAQQQLAQAEQKLEAIENKFDKLAKLERDLLELNRLAANAEQLAQRLRDLDKQREQPAPANETPDEKISREQLKQAEENQLLAEQKELSRQADELLQRQPELREAARQNQAENLAELTRKAEELAQPQQEVAADLREAANKAAENQKELAQKQEELRDKVAELNQQVEKQESGVEPLDDKALDQALADLQAGNLGAAAKEEERLAKLLDELERKLREEKKPAAKPDQAVAKAAESARKLADQQAEVAKEAQADADKGEASGEDQQTQTEQALAQEQEQLEKLPADKAAEAKKSAESALQAAAKRQQELADEVRNPNPDLKDKPDEQKQELERLLKENAVAQQEAADSLDQLAKQLQHAADKQHPEGEPKSTEAAQADLTDKPKAQSETEPMQGDSPAETTEKPSDAGKKEPSNSEKLDSQNKPKESQPAANSPDGSKPEQNPESSKPGSKPGEDAQQPGEEGAKPGEKSATKPEGSEGAQPEGAEGAKPAETGGAKPEGESNPEADKAGELAQEARDLQQQLEAAQEKQDLSGPKAQQEKLAQSLKELGQQIEEAEKRLAQSGKESNPAGQKPGTLNAESQDKPNAGEQAAAAQKAMEQARQELEQGNPERSAQAAEKAAEELSRLALDQPANAEEGQPANPENSRGKPMPGEGEAKDNSDAQQQPGDQPGDKDGSKPGQQTGSKSGQKPGEQGGQPAGEQAGSQPGDIPGKSAEQVQEAINQLQEALAESNQANQPSQNGGGKGKESNPDKTGQSDPMPGSKPGSKSESGQPGQTSEGAKPGESPDGTPIPGQEESPTNGAPSRKSKGQSSSPSPLQAAAKRLQQAASALKQASAACQCQNPGNGQGVAGKKAGSNGKGISGSSGPAGDQPANTKQGDPRVASQGGKNTPAADTEAEVGGNLDRLKQRLKGRKWGELPSNLQTEILQAAQKKPNSEYAELIRQYFKEIAKTQPDAKPTPKE